MNRWQFIKGKKRVVTVEDKDKNEKIFQGTIKTYFDIKNNYDGYFYGSLRNSVFELFDEYAPKLGYAFAIVPGEITVNYHDERGRVRYTNKNFLTGGEKIIYKTESKNG